jgi:hypothetical protein
VNHTSRWRAACRCACGNHRSRRHHADHEGRPGSLQPRYRARPRDARIAPDALRRNRAGLGQWRDRLRRRQDNRQAPRRSHPLVGGPEFRRTGGNPRFGASWQTRTARALLKRFALRKNAEGWASIIAPTCNPDRLSKLPMRIRESSLRTLRRPPMHRPGAHRRRVSLPSRLRSAREVPGRPSKIGAPPNHRRLAAR